MAKKKKITNVFQTGFDIAEKEGVTQAQRQRLVDKIRLLIDKEKGFVCVNGTYEFADMTDQYPMEEVNKHFNK